MITTPNVTSADTLPGGETRVRGEGYAQAVLDDEGSPALPLEASPLSLRDRVQDAFASLTRNMRARPLLAMGVALGLGYVVGRLRARN